MKWVLQFIDIVKVSNCTLFFTELVFETMFLTRVARRCTAALIRILRESWWNLPIMFVCRLNLPPRLCLRTWREFVELIFKRIIFPSFNGYRFIILFLVSFRTSVWLRKKGETYFFRGLLNKLLCFILIQKMFTDLYFKLLYLVTEWRYTSLLCKFNEGMCIPSSNSIATGLYLLSFI